MFFTYFSGPENETSMPSANEDIVSQLVSMGFNHLHCQKAAINTSNVGVEEAMNWLLSHMDDPGIQMWLDRERCFYSSSDDMNLDLFAPIFV